MHSASESKHFTHIVEHTGASKSSGRTGLIELLCRRNWTIFFAGVRLIWLAETGDRIGECTVADTARKSMHHNRYVCVNGCISGMDSTSIDVSEPESPSQILRKRSFHFGICSQ
jgi:hypothetical protein